MLNIFNTLPIWLQNLLKKKIFFNSKIFKTNNLASLTKFELEHDIHVYEAQRANKWRAESHPFRLRESELKSGCIIIGK